MTPSGIEPATFRFLAQHLNHCATAVLPTNTSTYKNHGLSTYKTIVTCLRIVYIIIAKSDGVFFARRNKVCVVDCLRFSVTRKPHSHHYPGQSRLHGFLIRSINASLLPNFIFCTHNYLVSIMLQNFPLFVRCLGSWVLH